MRGDGVLEDLDALYRLVNGCKGRVDIVFANAGFVDIKPSMSSPDHFDKTFDINVRGVLFAVQRRCLS